MFSGARRARLIQQHRIDAGDERLAGIVAAGQVPPDHIIRDGQEADSNTRRI